jgi:hypothetical protein
MRVLKDWKRLALLLGSGLLMQTPGCTETAAGITALASAITAGGVIYLVIKVID